MSFYGITRVRDEADILQDTLDHVATFLDGVVLVDDCSEDDTALIALNHPIVLDVLNNRVLYDDRPMAETIDRQRALTQVRKYSPDWILNFDADERFEFPEDDWMSSCDFLMMRLFDFYITPEDRWSSAYESRKWMGPEYRDIVMAWRDDGTAQFRGPIQREPLLIDETGGRFGGWVKHYGKAISVEHWEAKCDYYAETFPKEYREKWLSRKGQAVHYGVSDYGQELITWEQKELCGINLLSVDGSRP